MRLPSWLLPTWLLPVAVLAAAVWANVAEPSLLRSLRNKTFDEYQRIKPAVWEDASVRIVDIDEESLAKLGQWPWPRTRLADLLLQLGAAGAGVVAFDIVFSEPDRTSPQHLLGLWRGLIEDRQVADLVARLPDHDTVFAQSLTHVPSVLGIVLHDEAGGRVPTPKWGMTYAGDEPSRHLWSFRNATASLPQLEAVVGGQGSFNMIPDDDQVVRRVPMLVALRGADGKEPTLFPTLSLEALRVLQGASTYVVRSSNASGLTLWGESAGVSAVRVGQFIVPTDPEGRMWLRDTGPVTQRFIPAWKVLAGEIAKDELDGAIVFVGTSAPALRDLRSMPLNPIAAGVEIHARITEQILLGQFLGRPYWLQLAERSWLVALGLAMIVLLPRLGPVWCAVGGVTAIGGSVAASWFAFDRMGVLADPISPALAGLVIYIISSLQAFLRTERERRWIGNTFSQYLSPELVAELKRNPSLLYLGGTVREMTILFSDVRGFTSRSEKMSPAEVTRFINRFLTPMTRIVMAHRGYVDKYMGDAIMAFWSAPLVDEDHARNAARTALEMEAELRTLNATWAAEAAAANEPFEPVAIGIGLNSGSCSVGNFGSDQKFSYSVIGDEVNLASRLEGRSKTYGVTIVLGENLARRLAGWALIELDRVRVKGKAQPVSVYTLLGEDGAPFAAPAARHAAMLESFRGARWDEAEAALAALATEPRLAPLAGLYALYRDRIAAYRAAPPPPDWDGVETATEK
ncbi:MAG: adenylate/guanylate cyclase domain-containing protein [Alphaproteobacteria bacterium]|nr:adenylate/guanylate cyclase domain-containing protein [Alphaproteobacteria bacterium]